MRWVAAGLVAAVVASMAIFTKWGKGNALWIGLLMILAGVIVLLFFKGVPSAFPAGFIVAGGVVLANTYLVPMLPDAIKNLGVNGGA